MANNRQKPLPISPKDYNQSHMSILRKTIEENEGQISDRLGKAISKTSKESSLPLRRFQFLLMGA